MPTIEETLEQGRRYHQAGAFQQAEQLYKQVLKSAPNHADALHLLGALAWRMGNHATALEYLRLAVECHPNEVTLHSALAGIYMSKGDLESATACFRAAVQTLPSSAEAHYNLGDALRQQEKWDEAAACFQQALLLKPALYQAHNNLGNVLLLQNKLQEAEVHYKEALRINPRHGQAITNLATTLGKQGKLEEAVGWYQLAVRVLPQNVATHSQLGNALRELGKLTEAEACYMEMIRLQPDNAEAYCNLGKLYFEQAKLEEAANSYERALLVKPDSAGALAGLAGVLGEQGKHEESNACLEEALRLQPTAVLRVALATRLPQIHMSMAELQQSRQRLQRKIQQLHEEHVVMDVTDLPVMTSLFYLAYHGINDRDILRDVSRLYKVPEQSEDSVAGRQAKGATIRVGFISGYFKNHTIGQLTGGLVAQWSRDGFEVTVLSVGKHQDETAEFYKRHADRYLQVPLNLSAARRLIAAQELDVLFYTDIGMEAVTSTLARSRLAPVQCVTWGHPVTTAIDTIDYFISAEALETEDAAEHYTEKLVRLKNLAVYYYRPELPSPLKPRANFGLANKDHVYSCLQSAVKFHPEFDEILAGILRGDPLGKLLLIVGRAAWGQQLRRRFEVTMPDVLDRVVIFPLVSRPDFLNVMAVSDVLLDPIHFGGGNTSYEGFAMGTPIVTLPTQFLRGRITYALYQRMGVLDCVVASPREYIELALRLGTDPAFRETMRQKILAADEVLFENCEGVRELEQFIRRVEGWPGLAHA